MTSSEIRETAQRVATGVAKAWSDAYGYGDVEVPLSVLAAISFVSPPTEADTAQVIDDLTSMDHAEFADFVRGQWVWFFKGCPELTMPAWPLMRPWLQKDRAMDQRTQIAAKRVADVALKRGQLDVTGGEIRRQSDLLGTTLMCLRSSESRMPIGQYFTPEPITDFMARMITLEEGQSIADPCAGSGGSLRAAADSMRGERGLDPAKAQWVGVDTDEIAVGCLAVNSVLWGLGRKVLFAVGEGLVDYTLNLAVVQRYEMQWICEVVPLERRVVAALSYFTSLEPSSEVTPANLASRRRRLPRNFVEGQLAFDLELPMTVLDDSGARATQAPQPEL